MNIRAYTIYFSAVLLLSACSNKEGEAGGAEPAAQAGTSDTTGAAKAEGDSKPAPQATTGTPPSYEATVTGAAELKSTGRMAMAYDMAGFAHFSLNADDRSMAIDFNTKGTELPPVGKIELVGSNLRGWMATVDMGSDTYIAKKGFLDITSVEGGVYKANYEFTAQLDGPPGGASIEVKGSFTAHERKKK